jgi:hypothetical protein
MCLLRSFNFVRNLLNNGGLDGLCTSPFSSGAVLTYASPAVGSYTPATTTFTDNSALLFAVPVEGYNFAAAAATTGSSPINNSPTTGGASTPTATPQGNTSGSGIGNSNGQNQGGGGLSTGAKAGIGVGVAGAVLISAAIVVGFLLLRRRRPINELPGNGEHKDTTPAPIYAQTAPQAAQLESSVRPTELQA